MKKDIQFHKSNVLVRMKRFLIGMLIAQAIVLMAFSITKKENKFPILSSDIFDLPYNLTDFEQHVSEEAPKPKQQKSIQEDPFSKEPVKEANFKEVDEQVDMSLNLTGLEAFNAAYGVNMKMVDEDKIYESFAVSQEPEFPGGEKEMIKFIRKHYKVPYTAMQYDVRGVTFISFTIDKNGMIKDIHVTNPERILGYGIEEEAKRVIAMMPKWNPGMHALRKVNVKVIIPIKIE